MEENKKTTNKKAILDWIVAGIVIVALVVCFFFWGCDMDLWVSILCIVLVAAGSILLQMQNKKISNGGSQN